MMSENRAVELARKVAACYAEQPPVLAVALAGSVAAGMGDAISDIDLYVYSTTPLGLDERRAIAERDAARADVDNRFWEPGDEWIDRETGIKVDVMFRHPGWIEEQLDRVLRQHQASTGYSTCFWHNVLNSHSLYDRDGWYARLQAGARQPYPEALRRAVIAKNHPILAQKLSAYSHQIESAARRDDWVSINHRVAALLASYFDILFALNRLPHPGEKRLLRAVEERCEKYPPSMRADVEHLVRANAFEAVITGAAALVAGLDQLLMAEGLLE
ncbi:MAG: nucleotidyltransferase [Chloroflexota bacterium]|nr:MAG: nucleotidyltransferase [Chloroflexota bacterium]